jgi:HSP20 family protein
MALVKWNNNKDVYDPLAGLRTLQDEINDLFNLDRFPSTTGLFDRRSASPAIDVVEGANNLTVTCELPGMDQNDIDVSIASNVLTIKGVKKDEREEKKEKFYRKESWSGSFQRTLPLPATIDVEKINADFKDGILTVKLPKREEAKPKQITVKIK